MSELPFIKGKRPAFVEGSGSDDILAIVMALAQELAVLRERCDTYEQLLIQRKILEPEDVENFRPSSTVELNREIWRRDYLDRILWIVKNKARE